ncbi:unnamed protein product [Caenorhabditis brenneri]
MMNLTSKNIPYHETKKAKAEKVRLQTWNQHIDAIKSLMIERGIGTEKELSSQEKVLFKVVQWVTSEDLLSNYPPLKFTGNETTKDKHTAREKYRRGKQDAALGKIKNFILGAGIGKWRNTKTDFERVEILKLILEHIQNSGITSSTAVTSPCSIFAPHSPVSPARNPSTTNEGDLLPSAGSLPSSSQSQLSNIRSFPVVSPFLWNNSLPEILSSAMFVPVVPSLPAYNLYDSALQCYTLNRFLSDVSISVPTRESLKVDEKDKSEEEDVIIDIVGNANDKEDEELDIIN